MSNYYTENLADFGFREIKILCEILNAWVSEGLPDNFAGSGVRPAMNKASGYVFLTNDDYQCCMVNNETGSLEVWHNLPYSGLYGQLYRA